MDTSELTPSYLLITKSGHYLKLSSSAFFLLKEIASGLSFDELARSVNARGTTQVQPAELERAYQKVVARMLEVVERERPRTLGWVRLPLVPAHVVARLARPLATVFRPAIVTLLLGASLALIILSTARGIPSLMESAALWPAYLLFLISVLWHELGHASACARFGAVPSRIGFAIYLIFPVFFSDVTSAWQLKRWQRVVVGLGGTYFQLMAAGAYAATFLLTGWAPLQSAVVLILGSCAFSLNPVLKFDGYWVVADALGISNLDQQPLRLLQHAWNRLRGSPCTPLLWPSYIIGALVTYSCLALLFWVYFLYAAIPLVREQLVALPVLAERLTEYRTLPATNALWDQIGQLLVSLLVLGGTLASLGHLIVLLVRRLSKRSTYPPS